LRVSALLRNRCPLSIGIGVRNGLEWVSENYWNRCPDSSEYAFNSQDSEITGAFSFDRPVEKVLLFPGFVPNPSRLWVHCSEEGEVYEGRMGRRFTQLTADWFGY